MCSSGIVFGLSGDDWSALASASQALAAFGAIALLVVTLLSQRDARNAIENARLLASHTESLVEATRAQAELGVRPVIEVTFEARDGRFRLSNRGNGPLLAPVVGLNGAELAIIQEDVATSAFIRSVVIASGEHIFALIDSSSTVGGTMSVEGFTMSGSRYRSDVNISGIDSRSAGLAQPKTED